MMPCGGVRPCEIPEPVKSNGCWFCGKLGCGHFYEEFDTYCHAACFLEDLMANPNFGEAAVAIKHQHDIHLDTTRDKIPDANQPSS